MRRVIISLVAIIAMAVVFNACRKDSPVKGERVVKSNPEFTDCNEWIEEGSGVYYEKTYTASYQSGGSVTVKVYNTETRLVCSVTSSTDIHKLEIGGTLVYEGNDPAQQPVIHEITLGDYDEDWFACEEKTANIVAGRTNSSGQGAGMSVTNVTRWEGDVDACEVVTITIRYTGGNGIGDWSAKRGEVLIAATPEKSCN